MEAHDMKRVPQSLEERILHLEQLLSMHEETIELQAARISVSSLAIFSLIQSQPSNPLFARTLQDRAVAMLARGDASQEFESYVMEQLRQFMAAANPGSAATTRPAPAALT